jgi:hypothetical protein
MTAELTPSRWIVVVHSDRTRLLESLLGKFSDRAWVEVLVDRRRGERRRREVPFEGDQRLGDRRGVPGDASRTSLYRLACRGDGFDVYEATGPAPTRCPDCGATVTFEMPRFVEPPVRLDLRVTHESVETRSASDRARHLVELQSFAAGGRPLVATLSVARSRLEIL